jgi:hypothetical protein
MIVANDNDVVDEVEVQQQQQRRRRRLPRRQRRQQHSPVNIGASCSLAFFTTIAVIIVVTMAMLTIVSSVTAAEGWVEETRGIEMNESTFYANFVTLDEGSGRSHGAEQEKKDTAAVMDAKAEKVSENNNNTTKTRNKAAAVKTNKIVKGSYYGHGYTTSAPSAAGKTGKEHPPYLQSQSPATEATSKTDRQILLPHLLKCKKPKAAKIQMSPPPPPLPPPTLRSRHRNLLSPYYSNNNDEQEEIQQQQSQTSSTREGGGGGDVIDGSDDNRIDSTTGEEMKMAVYAPEEEEHVEIVTPTYSINNNKTNSNIVASVDKKIVDEETSTTSSTSVQEVEEEEYDYICDKYGQLLPNITTYDEYGQISEFSEITTFVPTISPPSESEEEEEDTTTATTTTTNDTNGNNGSDIITDSNATNNNNDSTTTTDDDGGPSPGCATWKKYTLGVDNVYYETNISAIVDFTYEIVIQQLQDSSSSIDEIVTGMMENRLSLLVGRELINCDTNDEQRSRRLLAVERQEQLQQHGSRRNRRLYVDGLVSTPMDEVVPNAKCEELSTTTKNSTCYVVNSKMTLYLRENDAATSIYQSTSGALKVIQTAMNDMIPSPFIEESDDTELSIMGVQSVRYIRGMPDEGMDYVTAGNGNIIDEDLDVNAITKAASELGPLSTAGIALIAIGSVAMLGILIGVLVTAISKKRKKQKAEGGEGKRDGADSPSNSSSKGRGGKRSPRSGLSTPQTYTEFFGEDDSDEDDISLNMRQRPEDNTSALPASSTNVFTSLWAGGGRKKTITQSPNSDDQSVPSDEDSNSLFSGLETGGGTSTVDGDRTVMTNRDILSVYNRDDNRSLAMTVEQGYEVKFRPSDGDVDDDVSFWRLPSTSKYEPKVKLVSPRYVNPAKLKSSPSRKSQYVGDTVDF